MILIRFIQGYFIDQTSYYELKWLLLGEWLNQGFRMYAQTFDYTGPLATFIYKYLYLIFGRSYFIHYGLSSVVIIFQAGIFNQLLLKNKAYDENSYMPAFLYMLLMVTVPDFMTLSPQLLSLTFVLLSLRNVLRRIDNLATDELFLNSGFFLGIAVMIHLPTIIYFVILLFALILFSTAATRRLLLYLFSFLLAFSLCTLYFYWRGDTLIFLDSYVIQNLVLNARAPFDFQSALIACVPFIFILLLSVFKTWSAARLTNYQQKIHQVIWLMFLGGGVTFFLSNEKSLHELVFMVPVIAYFWTHYFILLKRRIFKFIMPAFMILGLLYYSVFNYQSNLEDLTVTPILAEEQVMVLGADLNYYAESKMLTPCFDKHLTILAFEGLAYYHNSASFNQLFQKADPEVFIDLMGIMPEMMHRFPTIEKEYRKMNPQRYEKISN